MPKSFETVEMPEAPVSVAEEITGKEIYGNKDDMLRKTVCVLGAVGVAAASVLTVYHAFKRGTIPTQLSNP